MVDVDDRFAHFERKVDIEVGVHFDDSVHHHIRGVHHVYLWAWASCVSGRVNGLRTRSGVRTTVRQIGEERRELQTAPHVVARLVAAWMDDPRAITLDATRYADDGFRVQLLMAAAILAIIPALNVPDEYKRSLQAMAGQRPDAKPRSAGDLHLQQTIARNLRAKKDPGWLALRQAVTTFGQAEAHHEQLRAAWRERQALAGVFARQEKKRPPQLPLGGTENLTGTGVPKGRLLRDLDNADLDEFVERRYSQLEQDPYSKPAADDTPLPTPGMLGVFPHPLDDAVWEFVEPVRDALFDASLTQLADLSDEMNSGGFTTSSPLVDRAIAALTAKRPGGEERPLGEADEERREPEPPEEADEEKRTRRRAEDLVDGLMDDLRAQARYDIAVSLGHAVAADSGPDLTERQRRIVAELVADALAIASLEERLREDQPGPGPEIAGEDIDGPDHEEEL